MKPVVQMDVTDPNGDLGPQVLALNAATGRAYPMNPPRQVRDLKTNFPAGIYWQEIPGSGLLNPREWHFVVVDHKCNTTDILNYPHQPRPPKTIGR